MNFTIMTLFPDFIDQGLHTSILGRAVDKGLISYSVVNIRDYSTDKNGRVDDYTYGGGAGMLMQAQPVYDAYEYCLKQIENRRGVSGETKKVRTVFVTPSGRPFTQKDAIEFSKEDEIIFLCGHYEGIDERVLEETVTDRISIGDYVLTGGELPALVMIDAISRLVPGVLGNDASSEVESFYKDLLEYPQYTRPEVWNGKEVPRKLLTGNPKDTLEWRKEKAEELTRRVRPDLYDKYLQRNRHIDRLLRDKRNNIQILEQLKRGTGEIISEKPFIIYVSCDDAVMIDLDDTVNPDELFEIIPTGTRHIICSEKCAAILTLDERIKKSCDVRNYVYTEKTHRRIINKDIRLLDESHAGYVADTYALGGREYAIRQVLSGAVYGIFVDDVLAGYIGTHGEGSIGMLYVDEAYRHRGLAADLESFMFNRDLEAGRTPYGQIIVTNNASISLQEKIGVYGGDRIISWLDVKV